MTGDTPFPTYGIGHGLLKQRSRRLLGNVLKRRMLVDSMQGYSDELNYNLARRNPRHKRNEDLSDALENIKAMQQKILRAHAHMVPKPRADFIPGGAITSQRTRAIADNNANYVAVSSRNNKPYMNGNLSPPVSPNNAGDDHAKTSARSAISNALFQSMNFSKFVNRTDKASGKQQQPAILHNGKITGSQIAPVRITVNSRSNAQSPHVSQNRHRQGSSNVSTMSKVSRVQQEESHIPKKSTFDVSKNVKNVILNGEKDRTMTQTGQNTSLNIPKAPNGAKASQFRIKAISIAGGPQDSSTKSKRSRNYVTGVSVYKDSPPPASVTINLTPVQSSSDSPGRCTTPAVAVRPQTNKRAESMDERFASDVKNIAGKRDISVRDYRNRKTKSSETEIVNNLKLQSSRAELRGKSSGGELKQSPAKLNETIAPPRKERKLEIPKFYFPKGKPRPKAELETSLQKISGVCSMFKDKMVPLEEMGLITKACNVSLYWKGPLFCVASGNTNARRVSEDDLKRAWERVASSNNDPSSRFVSLLSKPGKECLDFEDFLPLLKDIVDTHPGLVFLKDAPEFHTRYMNTVIARIFYAVNRSWSGQITASELRKSNFLTVLSLLEEEDDINAITDYFSYEHFYVIYCKFWELDSDHDLVIDKHDLIGYGDGVLSSRLIDRVLSGAVTRWDTSDHNLGKMSYVDFVWFILSEEDKKSQTSIEYWYRCMDLDGDGYISMYEMEYFYEEQSQKLEQLDIEPLPFEDCVCQVFDIVNPSEPGKVSLRDLKKCKMAHVFFDTFFNVAKYLSNEQKDPFVGTDGDAIVSSDWDNFAAEEYELLVAEEQSNKLSDINSSILEENGHADTDMLNEHEPSANYESLKKSQEPCTSNLDKALESNSVSFRETNADGLMPLNNA